MGHPDDHRPGESGSSLEPSRACRRRCRPWFTWDVRRSGRWRPGPHVPSHPAHHCLDLSRSRPSHRPGSERNARQKTCTSEDVIEGCTFDPFPSMRPTRSTLRTEDSLDLLDRQDRVLEELFEAWRGTDPTGRDQGQKTKLNWERGTVAKLILEQGALRIAALDDVTRALKRCHQDVLAADVGQHIRSAKVCLGHIDSCTRGVTALDLRFSVALDEAIEGLRNLWIDDMRRQAAASSAVARALGTERKRLHSALYIRAHAPLHPSIRRRWYHKIPLMVRIHALYDLLRSFPDAESANWADKALSESVDQGGHLDV